VEFSAPTPPSMIEDETNVTNEVSMSDYCKFAQIVQSMPQIGDIEHDFDLGVELRSGSSDGAQYKFILYMDRVKWSRLMAKNDLHPELLRWYLLVNDFDFDVCDKGSLEMLGTLLTSLQSITFLIQSPPRKYGRAPDLKRPLLGRQPKLFFIF